MFHGVLMDIIQSRQPRSLKRQVSIPEFVHHSPPGSRIHPVEAYRELAVQVSYEIPVRRRAVFKADYKMIVVGEESPRLQNELVISRQFESCIAEKVQFCFRIEESFSMQRCRGNDVNAVRRKVMRRRVRPILAHKSS